MTRQIAVSALILAFGLCITAANAGITTHTYTFSQPTVEVVNGQTTVILGGAPNWGGVGEPLLPHGPVQLLLPPGEEAVSISIERADPLILGDGYRIAHMQQPYPLSVGPAAQPTPPDAAIYSSDDPFPAELSSDLQTQFLCGHAIATAVIYPVQYRPLSGQLIYYPWIRVKVESQPTPKAQQAHSQLLKRSRAVQERLEGTVHNPERIPIYGPQIPSRTDAWDMLLITPSAFVAGYQEFSDYKNRSGVRTHVITVEDIYAAYSGIDNQDKIRNCIIDYYTSYETSYVFLCGDNENIPARSFWCIDDHLPADLYYAALDGNWNDDGDAFWGEPGEEDLIAEVCVGRSCADTPEEIANFVNKTLKYQTEPVGDEIETALMTGEDLGWAAWGWEYKEEIRLGSSAWGYTTAGFPANFEVGTLYEYPGSYWSAMDDLLPLLNEGPTLVNHLGHANWNTVMQFGLSQISDNNFSNDGVNANYFIGYSQGCICGDFTHPYVDCILEAFTTISHGAVAFIGNSRYGWGSYSNTNGASQRFDRQFFDAIFGEGIRVIGGANQDSKEDNAWMVPSNDIIRWCYYCINLFGDPTLDIWTAEPGVFTPDYNPVALAGAQTHQVNSISLPQALVTVSMNGEVLGQGESNGAGTAVVTFDQPLAVLGELDLMITAHNMLPYAGTLLVIPDSGPYVIYSSSVIEDGGSGNGNGQLDYGEAVQLTTTVENVGVGNAAGVDLILSSDDPLVTVTDNIEYLGDLASGATGTLTDAFAFQISSSVEDGHEIEFILQATDGDSVWTSTFAMTAHAPAVLYQDLAIEDLNGNGDNHLDPGENANFYITIHNEGSSDAPELSVVLSSDEPLISIPQDSVHLSLLAAGAQTTIVYSGIVAQTGIAQGDSVEFSLAISAEGGYVGEQSFSIAVGDVRFDPVGPDEYGYYAYDPYDGEEAPEFNWVEIAPMAGGSGTDLQLGDDEVVSLPLPFAFQFYGVEYDEACVCSHGWLSLGITTIFFPNNICIPHIVPPNSMIAGFWDELSPAGGGQVCTLHDPANHCFIVEWYQVPHEVHANERVTFQIILLDPAYYPTLTGDGEAIVNYLELTNITPNFSMGVEDSSGTTGLEYYHNGSYAEAAMPLEAPFAIRYTTEGNNVGVEPAVPRSIPKEFALHQNYPNPFNPTTTICFALPTACWVKLEVFDISGRLVGAGHASPLLDRWMEVGYHAVTFDASNLASGLYIARLQAGSFTEAQKIVLMK